MGQASVFKLYYKIIKQSSVTKNTHLGMLFNTQVRESCKPFGAIHLYPRDLKNVYNIDY